MEIFRANAQWANRPEDQRFGSIEDMDKACRAYYDQARVAEKEWSDLSFRAAPAVQNSNLDPDSELVLVGSNGRDARIGHYAFGQLVERVDEKKPVADFLRRLPAELAAAALNDRIAAKGDRTKAQLLFHENGGLLLRAATSDVYERIWNWEVTARLLELQSQGFEVARPDFVFEGLPHSADPDLYASDHDMFAFIRHPDRAIDDGTEYGLRRGIIVANSEVGDCSLSAMYFLYRYQCGNHIIWGAQDVKEIRVAHRGEKARDRFGDYVREINKQLLDAPASDEEKRIEAARTTAIGATKDDVLEALFGKRAIHGLSKKQLTAGYDAVKPDEDGDPNTVWGFVNGLTRHSQSVKFADERTAIDRAAGKVLSIDF